FGPFALPLLVHPPFVFPADPGQTRFQLGRDTVRPNRQRLRLLGGALEIRLAVGAVGSVCSRGHFCRLSWSHASRSASRISNSWAIARRTSGGTSRALT